MRTVTWATFADAGSPMGLQTYEAEVMRGLAGLDPPGWRFQRRTVASLRSAVPADARIPLRALGIAHGAGAHAAGRWAYRGCPRVHRFDLRLPPAPRAEVVTVHDLPPLRFDDEGDLPAWAVASARSARAVICPSHFAAHEVRELLGVKDVVVIHNGVPTAVAAPPLTRQEREALGLHPERPFVLHAGGATRRKNLMGLAAAWASSPELAASYDLVLAGPPNPRRDALFTPLRSTRLIGFHGRRAVSRLMSDASCVVVPSVYEGFGLPALEAMAAGTPVVAADRGALPEVCADAALLCEPTGSGLAEALHAVLEDTVLSETLQARGRTRASTFTWKRSAQQHLRAYETFLP